MASFLQNDGDIILDAVLTDYGRKLLAKGDGSFNIVKFALSDDEINYSNFVSNAQPSEQDLEIMNTPILEAFTNNAASMKYKLMTIGAGVDNYLYLPLLKLNAEQDTAKTANIPNIFTNGYIIPVGADKTVNNALTGSIPNSYIYGVLNVDSRNVLVQQYMSLAKSNSNIKTQFPALYESEYNIQVDNRYCSIGINIAGVQTPLIPLSVDDDNIATYKLTEQTIINNQNLVSTYTDNNVLPGSQVHFTVIPSGDLIYSNNYFTKYGTSNVVLNSDQTTVKFSTLQMPLKVVGVNTGYSVDIPILFAKLS